MRVAEPDRRRRDGGGPAGVPLVRGAEPDRRRRDGGGERRWRWLYLVVLGVLAAEIAGLWALSLAFR